MSVVGRVSFVLLDNGATVSAPTNAVQLVIGCAGTGSLAAPFASTQANNILANYGYSPLAEAMGLVSSIGGLPVGVRAATNTAGANSAVTTTGAGSSVITVTGSPTLSASVLLSFPNGGTVGTTGIMMQVSYDNGRTNSPLIPLNTATTYVLPGLGVTLNFAAGTILTGQTATFGTREPLWTAGGIQAAIAAFLSSSAKDGGIGSVHVVGGSTATNFAVGASGADMVSLGGYLQSARQNQYVFTRSYMSARDASPPAAFGGTGETENAWMTSILSDYQGQSLNVDTTGRTSPCAAYWNLQSVFQNGLGVAPRYRQSVAYAAAQRQVTLAVQRMPSRVRDGALSPITIAPQDKLDGFVYHDESANPGLDSVAGGAGGWFSTTTRIAGKNGVFLRHANLFSPSGSQYGFMPQGLVSDDACAIAYGVAINNIDDDVRLITPAGTLDPGDAETYGGAIRSAIRTNMTNAGALSSSAANPDGCLCTFDTNTPVGQSGVNINLSLVRKGYILQETIFLSIAPGT